jgi:hypothetical protein
MFKCFTHIHFKFTADPRPLAVAYFITPKFLIQIDRQLGLSLELGESLKALLGEAESIMPVVFD